MTISVPPEIEGPLADQAKLQGMAPEALAVETLRKAFPALPDEPVPGETLYDAIKDFIGVVEGTGESLPQDCGDRFTEYLLDKKRRGHL